MSELKTVLCCAQRSEVVICPRQCPFSGKYPPKYCATKNSSTTAPQTFQDQPQIVSGTAQERINAVTFGALEMVASQPTIGFQMTDDRLNRLATFQTFPDSGGNPAPLSRGGKPHCRFHHGRGSRDRQTPLQSSVH